MNDDRARWEERHGSKADEPLRPPSRFLERHLAALPIGTALDLACGDGRNAVWLARQGFVVDAVDIARAALRRASLAARREGLTLRPIQADLDSFPFPRDCYDVAVNVRFLQRALFPTLTSCVRPGGLIVFETFTRDQAAIGHPSNPAYLLEPGELRRAFATFEVLAYEEGRFDTETGPAYLARILARRPDA